MRFTKNGFQVALLVCTSLVFFGIGGMLCSTSGNPEYYSRTCSNVSNFERTRSFPYHCSVTAIDNTNSTVSLIFPYYNYHLGTLIIDETDCLNWYVYMTTFESFDCSIDDTFNGYSVLPNKMFQAGIIYICIAMTLFLFAVMIFEPLPDSPPSYSLHESDRSRIVF